MPKGFASLATMIVATIVLIAIGIAVTSVGFTELLSGATENNARLAYRYAATGANDALLRLAKNKKYFCDSGPGCPYQIAFVLNGCSIAYEGCALVLVGAGVGSSLDPKIITATGRVKSNVRVVQVTVVFDSALNGKIESAVWKEIVQ